MHRTLDEPSESRQTAGVPDRTAAFVGRTHEQGELTASLDEAMQGRGSVWLLAGEPGIGKSRLAEEVARLAVGRGFDVLWGRCWEAGGAPAYWPWIQVLRALLRGRSEDDVRELAGPHASVLPQLLPELGPKLGEPTSAPALAPEQARFQLLDAAAWVLTEAAEKAPLAIFLEDLHASDPSSVMLLDFLLRPIRDAAIMVVGTYRETDAERVAVGPLLSRLATQAKAMPMRRLTRPALASYLERAMGKAPDAELLGAVFDTTEGNPLFVVETVRLLLERERHGSWSPSEGIEIPSSLRATLRRRLEELSEPAREVLELAAVFGRDLSVEDVTRAGGWSADEVSRHLVEAAEHALVVASGPGQYRFEHILVREVLHQDTPQASRWRLHRRVADQLARGDEREVRWSEVAHHLLEAGPAGREPAIRACVRAADQARAQHAFAEAASVLSKALHASERLEQRAPEMRIRLLLELGAAQLRAGQLKEGRSTCREAADVARMLGSASDFATAALEYGSVLVFAEVDPMLVALLEEALAQLGQEDGDARARVMGRLAAAIQPCSDPERAFALARDAIALARRVGEPATLQATLRSAISAFMDLGDPRERAALNREYVELTRSVDDRAEQLRGTIRLVFDLYELGDLNAARSAISDAHQLAVQLDQPHYEWQVAALRAMSAIWDGRFRDAERFSEDARALVEHARDPNGRRALAMQKVYRLYLEARDDEAVAEARTLESLGGDGLIVEQMMRVVLCGVLSHAGRVDEIRGTLQPGDGLALLAICDLSMAQWIGEIAWAIDDRELASGVKRRLAEAGDRLISGGAYAMTWEGFPGMALGTAEAVLGDWSEAERHLEAAALRASELGARPAEAWVRIRLAEVLSRRGRPEDSARMKASARAAEACAVATGLDALAHRARALAGSDAPTTTPRSEPPRTPATETEVPRVALFRLEREGELWRFECEDQTFRLKDSKGVRFLARLVEEPGRELHVLDLMSPGAGQDGVVDRGDAGEVLDAQAREAYRRRAEELREELVEAESWNDRAREERIRAELEALATELSRAVGLGGRERRQGSSAEKARINVQRRLRDAIGRVSQQCPKLGRHLTWAVRTGAFCSYCPD